MKLTTRYPILTACVPHSVNSHLEKNGAQVFAIGLDPLEEFQKNAALLRSRVELLHEKTGADKVNIISFNLAGLAARAAASDPAAAETIASVTTVCTPHRGMRSIDRLMSARLPRLCPAYLAYAAITRALNDRSPKIWESTRRMTTENMRAFNLLHPDAKGVFYQSAVCAMQPEDDRRLAAANNTLAMYDGENDGFVSVYSAMWGQYCRVYRGVSHMSIPPEVYADMVQSLIARGL